MSTNQFLNQRAVSAAQHPKIALRFDLEPPRRGKTYRLESGLCYMRELEGSRKSFHHPIDAVHMVEQISPSPPPVRFNAHFFVCSGSGSNDAQLKTHMQRTS